MIFSQQLVLKAKINCLPAPAVTWWKGETDVTKSSSFKVTKDPNGFDTLIIASANRSSAGEFTIKATNEMGTTSSKCTIKVNSKWTIYFDLIWFGGISTGKNLSVVNFLFTLKRK